MKTGGELRASEDEGAPRRCRWRRCRGGRCLLHQVRPEQVRSSATLIHNNKQFNPLEEVQEVQEVQEETPSYSPCLFFFFFFHCAAPFSSRISVVNTSVSSLGPVESDGVKRSQSSSAPACVSVVVHSLLRVCVDAEWRCFLLAHAHARTPEEDQIRPGLWCV